MKQAITMEMVAAARRSLIGTQPTEPTPKPTWRERLIRKEDESLRLAQDAQLLRELLKAERISQGYKF